MRDWLDPPEAPPPVGLAQALELPAWLAGVLAQRGLTDPTAAQAFLDPQHYRPAPPDALPGLDDVAARLLRALQQGESILVWGDFDVDGQTATALLVDTLRELGGRVRYHVPVRAQESHGVSPTVMLRWLADPEPPRVVLTCDTGIAAFEAAEIARAHQVDLLITDHHELPHPPGSDSPHLPSAAAIVTPRFLPAGHPLAGLPGAGVAYKLAEALFALSGRPESVERHLDLAALGIVADVAWQSADTRYLLQRGLDCLRRTQRLGLQAVYERAELNPQSLSEEHIGFIVAPRLNALGRLGDANPAVELLTTTDLGRARLLAAQLEGLNTRRQLITSQILRGALAQIQQDRRLLDFSALVLSNPSWEAGVIGIVASRLVELYDRPVVMIAVPPGSPGRASARSVEGVDITAAIASQADLLLGYGGHAMAAGFAIPAENIPAFRSGLSRAVAAARAAAPRASRPLQIDAYFPWQQLSLDVVAHIERLAPFGPGNPPVTLASRNLRLVGQSKVGRQQEHLLLTLEDESGVSRQVIWWDGADMAEAAGLPSSRFDLAFRARSSTYRGESGLQLELVDFRPLPDGGEIELYQPVVEDYRSQAHPWPVLQSLLSAQHEGELLIWAEGQAAKKLQDLVPTSRVCHRYALESPLHTLVIWTSPPSPADLRNVLQRLRPHQLVLFAVEPEEQSLPAFLERLAGLARHVLSKRAGRATLSQLAAVTAQRELTVLHGLEWLAAQGQFSLRIEGEVLDLSSGGATNAQAAALQLQQVHDLWDETRAYRAYYRRAADPLH